MGYAFLRGVSAKKKDLEYIQMDGYCIVSGIGNYKKEDISIPAEYNGLPVTEIFAGSFAGADILKSVTIPDSVTSIGGSAFAGCVNLENIDIPKSVTSIGARAFQNCEKLQKIRLPRGMSLIAPYIFNGCVALHDVNIPSGVATIARYAFCGCKNLTSITIPKNVESILAYAFYGCDNLAEVEFEKSASWKTAGNTLRSADVLDVGIAARYLREDYCSYSWELTKDFEYALLDDRQAYSIIGPGYYADEKNISIPAEYNGLPVVEVGDNVFEGKCIESVEIGDNVEKIGRRAFQGCTMLSFITIPEKVEIVSYYAFKDCENLGMVQIDGATIFYDGVFEGCNISAVYAKENKWGEVDFLDKYSSPLHKGAYLYFDGRIVADISISYPPSRYKFAGCTSLRYVEMVASFKVCWIGESAFEGCVNLRCVIIPETVRKIYENAFKDCVNLHGDGSIPEYAPDVENVAFLKLPENLVIYPHAFENCSSLEWVDIGENLDELTWNNGADGKYLVIGAYAFKGCTSLYNTTISKYWVATGYNAFAETGLRYLDLVDEPSFGMWLADSTNNNWTRAPFIENYEKSCAEFYMAHTEEIIFLSGYNLTYGDILRGDEA